MKKKTLKKIVIIAVILGIIIILITIGKFNLFTLVPTPPIYQTNVLLLNEDSSSATYSFDAIFSSVTSRAGECRNNKDSFEINFEIVGDKPYNDLAIPVFADDLIEETYFKADSPTNDVKAIVEPFPCKDVQIVDNGTYSECKIKNMGLRNGQNRALVTCKFVGKYLASDNGNIVSAGFYGLSHISTTVTFPRIGFCQSGLNKCLDGTCKENCNVCPIGENCNDNYWIYIILAIVIIIILYFTVYKKYGKSIFAMV